MTYADGLGRSMDYVSYRRSLKQDLGTDTWTQSAQGVLEDINAITFDVQSGWYSGRHSGTHSLEGSAFEKLHPVNLGIQEQKDLPRLLRRLLS